MCRRGLFTNHRLILTKNGQIQCEKCWGMWDIAGRELVPYDFLSWRAWRDECWETGLVPAQPPDTYCSGKNPLAAREIARVLADNLIIRNRLEDKAEIRALRTEAAETPEQFIEDVMGANLA